MTITNIIHADAINGDERWCLSANDWKANEHILWSHSVFDRRQSALIAVRSRSQRRRHRALVFGCVASFRNVSVTNFPHSCHLLLPAVWWYLNVMWTKGKACMRNNRSENYSSRLCTKRAIPLHFLSSRFPQMSLRRLIDRSFRLGDYSIFGAEFGLSESDWRNRKAFRVTKPKGFASKPKIKF